MQGNKKVKDQPNRHLNETTICNTKISPDLLVEEIRKGAKEVFNDRGSSPSGALGDWLHAEREIKAEYGIE